MKSYPVPFSVFPLGRLDLANYFLAIVFFFLSLYAIFTFRRVKILLGSFSVHILFYIMVMIHCIIRCSSFSLLAIYTFTRKTSILKFWYALMNILFIFPEFIFLSLYVLLILKWIELYIFSHNQYIFSFRHYETSWKSIYTTFQVLFILCQIGFYISLFILEDDKVNYIVNIISFVIAYISLSLSTLALFVWLFFSISLSGYPYMSSLDSHRIKRINIIFLIWSIGRLIRGVLLIISSYLGWANISNHILNDNIMAIIVVAEIVIVECFPLFLSMDWPSISTMFMSSYYQPLIDQQNSEDMLTEQKYLIDKSLFRFIENNSYSNVVESFKAIFPHLNQDIPVILYNYRIPQIHKNVLDHLGNKICSFAASVDHPLFEHVYGYYIQDDTHILTFVVEYFDFYNLLDFINQRTQRFDYRTILLVSKQILSALDYLHHQLHISHGSLTSYHILINNHFHIKVRGLGMNILYGLGDFVKNEELYAPWMSPEYIKGKGSTEASDIYAFGVILWHMIYAINPSSNFQPQPNQQYPFPCSASDLNHDLFDKILYPCWEPVEKRPTPSDLLDIIDNLEKDLNAPDTQTSFFSGIWKSIFG